MTAKPTCPPHDWDDERCLKCGTKDWMCGEEETEGAGRDEDTRVKSLEDRIRRIEAAVFGDGK